MSSGAMTGRLDSLERAGLITRTPHPSDRRVMFAELTRDGIDLIDEVFALHLANEEALLDGLAAPERTQIAAALALLERTMQTVIASRQAPAPRRPRRTDR
ncbi:MarR family transcriptional regulator [Actinomadura yumaensis]|uniref:MarR family transcriptional regulator n=1 Tax=Actinomadura yumaensis TaxID=111807 RepID=UPI003621C723